jgi:hypothetical protein
MQKNVASQKVIVYAYNELTGAAVTSDSGNFTKVVSKDGASTGSGAGSFSEIASGYYAYAPSQAETDCDLFLLITTSSTANVVVDAVIIYTRVDDSIETKIDTVDGIVDSILVDTGTTLDGKIDTIDGIVDAILVDTGTTLDGKIDVIDGIVDAILVDTDTTLPGLLSTIDTVCDLTLSDTAALTSATFVDGKSLAEAMEIVAAVLAGEVSGAGTGIETFSGINGAKSKVIVTVDSDGNRSNVSYG